MSKYVLKLLESYNERERKIAVLRYNLEHPTTVSRAEQIEAMNFRHEIVLGIVRDIFPIRPFTLRSITKNRRNA